MSLLVDKIPPKLREWVSGKGMYLFSTRKEDWRRGEQKIQSFRNKSGRPITRSPRLGRKIAVSAQKTPHMTRRAGCLGAPTCAADPAAWRPRRSVKNGVSTTAP